MRKILWKLRLLIDVFIVALVFNSSLCAQQLIPVGDLGGGSTATAINDSGQIVGSAYGRAYLYSNGALTYLQPAGDYSYATGINNAGQVVGTSSSETGTLHAFLYSNGTVTNLSALGGSSSGYGYGINNSGQVVGSAGGKAYLYANGTAINLEAIYGTSASATRINDAGQIIGSLSTSSGDDRGFLYSNGIVTTFGATSVGSSSYVTAINNLGDVIGTVSGQTFIYSNGISTTIPTYWPFAGQGINDSGVIVGTMSGFSEHAYLYSNGTLVDLNTMAASLLVSSTGTQAGFISLNTATDINNCGDIVGQGTWWDGNSTLYTEAYLLTGVPEPSTCVALGAGLVLLTVTLRHRKSSKPKQ